MSNDEFEWKGVRFSWNHHRAALKGNVILSGKTYWLLVREQGGLWESWCEFEGGYTQACTMETRDDALDGTLISIKDFLQASLLALVLLMAKPAIPPRDEFHAHLDDCKRCNQQPFDLCPVGLGLFSRAAK